MIRDKLSGTISGVSLLNPWSAAKTLVYTILLLGVYYSPLGYLLHLWGNEDYSYCWFVPFTAVYLTWEKRAELSKISSRPTPLGLVLITAGIGLFWLGELAGEYYALHSSLWLVIVGLLWMHFGSQKIKAIWFALVILLAAIPFPNVINFPLALRLRLISSEIGVKLLHLAGMVAYREGNVIDLGFTQLQVVDACSGIRYLFPLMLLTLLLAYWFKARFWKRAVLFLSSIPVAIIVNALRIAITGMLYPMMGAAAAEGFFHDFSGWLIFMITIPILLGEMWILKKLPGGSAKE